MSYRIWYDFVEKVCTNLDSFDRKCAPRKDVITLWGKSGRPVTDFIIGEWHGIQNGWVTVAREDGVKLLILTDG